MELTYDILQEFESITSKNIAKFFGDVLKFLNSDYNTIVAFYSGKTLSISSEPFNTFSDLKGQRDTLLEVIQNNIRQFTNLKWFLLIERFEEVDSRLKALDNINRWSRSSFTKVGYSPNIQLEYTLKQQQPLERVAQDVVGSTNPNDDWYGIATDNYLREEDYDTKGGTNMNLKLPNLGANFRMDSVVDVMQGKTVYGKDLDKHFGFDGNDDLKVLGYDDTIQQAIEILIGLRKNDIPSAPSLGLQQNMIVGSNRVLLNFPVIIRQLSASFASDDSLKNFTVSKIGFEQDNLTVEYSVRTRLGEILGNTNTN